MKMTGQVTVSEFNDAVEKLKLVEKRVWDNYFPAEYETFGVILRAANDTLFQYLHNLLPPENNPAAIPIDDTVFKKLLDKFYSSIPKKILNNIKGNLNGWNKFLPEFLNVYVLEIAKDDSLRPFEKILAMTLLRESIDKIALLGNVNLYLPFQVSIAFLEKEIKNRKEVMQAQWDALMKAIEEDHVGQIEDMHFWPGSAEQLDRFYNLLLKYRLIFPNPNYRLSFLEKLSKENQLILVDRKSRNKILIYLLYLLYGNTRDFKGYSIHNIAVHVFNTKDGSLSPRHLNTQLGRLYSKERKTILTGSLDDSLRTVQQLFEEFNSPVATLRLTATT